MPWKVPAVSEQRQALVQLVETLGCPVMVAARRFGVSRTTAYKWLRRHREDKTAPMVDRSRRPRRSPAKTAVRVELRVLQVHDQFGWGARKVRAFLRDRGLDVPSVRTVHAILERHDRVNRPSRVDPEEPQRFERSTPNELWQLDHKGPLEVDRRRRHPLTVMDDHSRYLLLVKLCDDVSHRLVWQHLWRLFGDCGMPQSILSDHAFGTRRYPKTLSAFERDLIRLDITPIHGRPYHPQTQGKVERLHRTFESELYPRARHDSVAHFEQDARVWQNTYNTLRPHESIDDRPPVTRWRPSTRLRPRALPRVEYPNGSIIRSVSPAGDIRFRGYRIRTGKGLAGHHVRLEEGDAALAIFYSWKRIRLIPNSRLRKNVSL